MPKDYSTDLRWRIVWSYLVHHSTPAELAGMFSLSERSVRRYIELFHPTGDIEPKDGGHGPLVSMNN